MLIKKEYRSCCFVAFCSPQMFPFQAPPSWQWFTHQLVVIPLEQKTISQPIFSFFFGHISELSVFLWHGLPHLEKTTTVLGIFCFCLRKFLEHINKKKKLTIQGFIWYFKNPPLRYYFYSGELRCFYVDGHNFKCINMQVSSLGIY